MSKNDTKKNPKGTQKNEKDTKVKEELIDDIDEMEEDIKTETEKSEEIIDAMENLDTSKKNKGDEKDMKQLDLKRIKETEDPLDQLDAIKRIGDVISGETVDEMAESLDGEGTPGDQLMLMIKLMSKATIDENKRDTVKDLVKEIKKESVNDKDSKHLLEPLVKYFEECNIEELKKKDVSKILYEIIELGANDYNLIDSYVKTTVPKMSSDIVKFYKDDGYLKYLLIEDVYASIVGIDDRMVEDGRKNICEYVKALVA